MQTVGYINTNKDHLHGQKWNNHCEGTDLNGSIILKWTLRVIEWDGWSIFGSEQILRDSERDRDVRCLKR